ncbi:copper amine oxidase N-terminal domain-containing protein [Cohnella mopanensis]|uniref:copper amine oxidase N-terminal domain-containing protein n=1 Tax=Cohnella mopanensis TaxID=2911966 RepID=UPI001EF8F484|nr:copper amine oxidase N-terminal domain-containing protein [Cohnella mopanensis]
MNNGLRYALSVKLCVLFMIATLSVGTSAASYPDHASLVAAQPEPKKPETFPTFEFDEGDVAIKWNPELDAKAWKVYRSENNDDYLLLHDSFLEEPNYLDQTALAGKTYYYVVEGFDDNEQLLYYTPPMKAIINPAQLQPASGNDVTILLRIGSRTAKVNGQTLTLSVAPTVIDHTTLVPLRFVTEALGADVKWNGKEQKVTLLMNGNQIELWLNDSIAKVNGSQVALSVPAKQINGSTMVPLRFVSHNLQLKVAYANQTQTLTISSSGVSDSSAATDDKLPNAGIDKMLALLKSGKTNSGRSLQNGQVYGKQFHISFQDYNEQTREFGGTLEWMDIPEIDTLKGKVEGNQLVIRQVSRYSSLDDKTSKIDGLITVTVTDANHMSGTWSVSGNKSSGTIRFTLNPEDMSMFFHTYRVYSPSSSATSETEEDYTTLTGVGSLNGGLLIKSNGTYEWNSLVDGKVIRGKWVKTGDVDWPLKLVQGEQGNDWSVAEAIHETGASIYLWDGTHSLNARRIQN